MRQTPIEYTRKASRAREPLIQPSPSLGRTIRKLGIRRLIRQGFGRRIIEKISRREPVKGSTYREYERRIEEYARRRQRPERSLSLTQDAILFPICADRLWMSNEKLANREYLVALAIGKHQRSQ